MPGIDGLSLLEQIHRRQADLPIIIATAHSDLDSAVNAYQRGAFEYLPAVRHRRGGHPGTPGREPPQGSSGPSARLANRKPPPPREIIGEAPAMQEVFRAIGRLSRSSISVLINGQSGTGKELVAHALHKHSPGPRTSRPQHGGHPERSHRIRAVRSRRGAFTGANNITSRPLRTGQWWHLFLDEIGDMPLDVQTRLLRVLADGPFLPGWWHQPVQVDVRIIAADPPESGKAGHRRRVPGRPVPPPQRHPHPYSALKNAGRISQLAQHFLLRAAKEPERGGQAAPGYGPT